MDNLESNSDAPIVSIVVCTRNRSDKLRACLTAIQRMKPTASSELVVVDNGSTDETPRVLEEFRSKMGATMITATEARRGLSRGLNRALALTRGEIIVFVDDDCYPAPDLIERTVEAMHLRHLDYVGGRIELYDTADASITTKTDPEPLDIPPMTHIRPGLLHGCNMAVRRSVFDKIGAFDPLMGVGGLLRSAGDVDLLQRASLAGFVGGYEPSVVTFHHHGRRDAAVAQLMRRYSVGKGAYYGKILLLNPRFAIRILAERRAAVGSTIGLLKRIYWALRRDVVAASCIAFGFGSCVIVYPIFSAIRCLRVAFRGRLAS